MEGYKETTLFTTPEATVGIQEYHFDENSTETYPLYMRGVYVGELSWGLFSRYYHALEKNGKDFGDIGDCACGIILMKNDVALESDEDVRNYEAELKTEGSSILRQVTEYMGNYIDDADCKKNAE